MQVEWHKFEDGMPEEGRELWIWGGAFAWEDKGPAILDSMSPDGYGYSYEYGSGFEVKTGLSSVPPIYWAYMDRPEPPTE